MLSIDIASYVELCTCFDVSSRATVSNMERIVLYKLDKHRRMLICFLLRDRLRSRSGQVAREIPWNQRRQLLEDIARIKRALKIAASRMEQAGYRSERVH